MPVAPILVLGSINVDLVIRSDRLPAPGETMIGGQFFQAAGGKGANQAVAAVRLHHGPVTFVAAVGDDPFGTDSIANLKREGLRCEFLSVIPGVATGVALILVDAHGQNLISVASGANDGLSCSVVENLPAENFAEPGVFLAPLETPFDTVAAALRRARSSGWRTILNPAPAAALASALNVHGAAAFDLTLVDILVPNEVEATQLTGIEVRDPASAERAGQALFERGFRAIVITLGSQGTVLVERSRSLHIPARPVTAIDTTAAGDCFCGALAVALAEGKSIDDAIRWSNLAASISVTRPGAQPSLPRRNELDALFRELSAETSSPLGP